MNRENFKDNLKIALMLVALFAVVAIPVAIALNYIWSQTVSVTVTKYTLTISQPSDGTTFDSYTFTGVLNLDGQPIEGETVTLCIYDDGTGEFVPTAFTDITATDGSYSITWSTDTPGTYTFKTLVEIP